MRGVVNIRQIEHLFMGRHEYNMKRFHAVVNHNKALLKDPQSFVAGQSTTFSMAHRTIAYFWRHLAQRYAIIDNLSVRF